MVRGLALPERVRSCTEAGRIHKRKFQVVLYQTVPHTEQVTNHRHLYRRIIFLYALYTLRTDQTKSRFFFFININRKVQHAVKNVYKSLPVNHVRQTESLI
jgi:hypothetical protein